MDARILIDMATAAEWFQRAAPRAIQQHNITLAVLCWTDLTRSLIEKKDWNYWNKRQNNLGLEIIKNEEKSDLWFLRAARCGHARAQLVVGNYYRYTERVLDLATDIQYYQELCDDATFILETPAYRLGVFYYEGRGVPKNKEKAVIYLEQVTAINPHARKILSEINKKETCIIC